MSDVYLESRLAAVKPAHLVVACQALINRARLHYNEIKAGKGDRAAFAEVVEALLNLVSVVEATPQVSPGCVKELRAGVERVLGAGRKLAQDGFGKTLPGLDFFIARCAKHGAWLLHRPQTTRPASPPKKGRRSTTMTDSKTTRSARQASLKSALVALKVQTGAAVPKGTDERVAGYIQTLQTGTGERKGKPYTLNITATAMLILKVCKARDWQAVPQQVRARFPWANISPDTLRALAEAELVEPEHLLLALGLAPTEPPVAPAPPQAASESQPEPQDAPEPEPEPVAPVRRTRQGR